MNLSSAQQTTFRNWLTANANGLSDQDAANLANTNAAGPYQLWNPSPDRTTVDSAIDKSAFTPSDAAPVSPSTDMTYQNRALLCQLKQTNAQWLTAFGVGDARVPGLRKNFQDCLRAIPSGASGAASDAGWGTAGAPGAVRLALMTPATNFQKLYVVAATGVGNDGVSGNRGTNTNPDVYGMDASGQSPITGPVTSQNVAEIRG